MKLKPIVEILITADLEDSFRLARNIMRWPEVFPHYQEVKEIGQTKYGKEYAIAVRWLGMLLKYRVIQQIDNDMQRVTYLYSNGILKGLLVTWRLNSYGEMVRVSIIHDLLMENAVLRSFPGKLATGWLLLKPIAKATLADFKVEIMREQSADKLTLFRKQKKR